MVTVRGTHLTGPAGSPSGQWPRPHSTCPARALTARTPAHWAGPVTVAVTAPAGRAPAPGHSPSWRPFGSHHRPPPDPRLRPGGRRRRGLRLPDRPAWGFFGSLPGLGVHVNDVVGIVPTNTTPATTLWAPTAGSSSSRWASRRASSVRCRALRVRVNDIVGIVPTNNYTGYDLVGAGRRGLRLPAGPAVGASTARSRATGIHVDNIVGIAVTGDDQGYWLAGSTGHVYNLGDAPAGGLADHQRPHRGHRRRRQLPGWLAGRLERLGLPLRRRRLLRHTARGGTSVANVVSIVPTPTGNGYWIIGADGRVFAFGDAASQGTLPSLGVAVGDVVGRGADRLTRALWPDVMGQARRPRPRPAGPRGPGGRR